MLEWTCHICGKVRPDSCISVMKRDISEKFGLPAGTMIQNVRYCNDDPDCEKKSELFSFFKDEEGDK